MKKFLKLIAGIGILAAIACGIYYIYKNYFEDKDWEDDMDDEDFEDEEDDEDDDSSESRGYVTINIDDAPAEDEEPAEKASVAAAEL